MTNLPSLPKTMWFPETLEVLKLGKSSANQDELVTLGLMLIGDRSGPCSLPFPGLAGWHTLSCLKAPWSIRSQGHSCTRSPRSPPCCVPLWGRGGGQDSTCSTSEPDGLWARGPGADPQLQHKLPPCGLPWGHRGLLPRKVCLLLPQGSVFLCSPNMKEVPFTIAAPSLSVAFPTLSLPSSGLSWESRWLQVSLRTWAGPHPDYDLHRMYTASHWGCWEAHARLPPERSISCPTRVLSISSFAIEAPSSRCSLNSPSTVLQLPHVLLPQCHCHSPSKPVWRITGQPSWPTLALPFELFVKLIKMNAKK